MSNPIYLGNPPSYVSDSLRQKYLFPDEFSHIFFRISCTTEDGRVLYYSGLPMLYSETHDGVGDTYVAYRCTYYDSYEGPLEFCLSSSASLEKGGASLFCMYCNDMAVDNVGALKKGMTVIYPNPEFGWEPNVMFKEGTGLSINCIIR